MKKFVLASLLLSAVGALAPAIASAAPYVYSTGNATTCGASSANGFLYCFGDNSNGEIGDGTTTQRPAPTLVSVIGSKQHGNINALAGGMADNFTCATVSSSSFPETVWCWGADGYGELGNGTVGPSSLVPVEVTLPVHTGTDGTGHVVTQIFISNITAGNGHACFIASGIDNTLNQYLQGAVYCWGRNNLGQLGLADTTDRDVPTLVIDRSGGTTWLSAGGNDTCAVSTSGTSHVVQCWGDNSLGQLGDNLAESYRTAPGNQLGFSSGSTNYTNTMQWVSVGYAQVCATPSSSSAEFCWGSNTYGAVGDGTTVQRNQPKVVSGTFTANTGVWAGGFHSCGIAVGDWYCWGDGYNGQIGHGNYTITNVSPTVTVNHYLHGIGTASNISAGGYHTCGVSTGTNGGFMCWGDNYYGELGTNDGVSWDSPTYVVNPPGTTW